MLPETELTILVRTCCDRPRQWEKFLQALTLPDASGEQAIDQLDILDCAAGRRAAHFGREHSRYRVPGLLSGVVPEGDGIVRLNGMVTPLGPSPHTSTTTGTSPVRPGAYAAAALKS